jgi:hypothetical protein
MEQNRTPPVFLHQPKLAWQTPDQFSDHRQPDRSHHYRHRAEVHAELDEGAYHSGIKVTDKESDSLKIRRDKFHGDWNYEILPS